MTARPGIPLGKYDLIAWLFVLVIYSLPLTAIAPVKYANEHSRISLTVAITEFGSTSITKTVPGYGVPFDHAVRDGQIYSDKAPGTSLLAAPLSAIMSGLGIVEPNGLPHYGLLRNLATFLVMALPASLMPFMLLAFCAGPSSSQLDRTATALIMALCSPMLPYSTRFWSHMPCGVMLAAGYILLLGSGISTTRRPLARYGLGGFALGLAATTEYPGIIPAALILGATSMKTPRPKLVLAAGLGMLAGLAPALIYQSIAFGSPWVTGYAFKGDAGQIAIHSQGLMGLTWPSLERIQRVLFSTRRGIVYYFPAILIVVAGLVTMARNRKPETFTLAGVLLAFLLVSFSFVDWAGGWCAANRYFSPALILMSIPMLEGLTWLRKTAAGSAIAVALVGFSTVTAILSISVSCVFPDLAAAPLSQLALRSVFQGAAFQSVFSQLGMVQDSVVLAGTALLIAILVTIALDVLVRGDGPPAWVACSHAAVLIASTLFLMTAAPRPNVATEFARALHAGQSGNMDVALKIASKPGVGQALRNTVVTTGIDWPSTVMDPPTPADAGDPDGVR